jgi:hypothetical protein
MNAADRRWEAMAVTSMEAVQQQSRYMAWSVIPRCVQQSIHCLYSQVQQLMGTGVLRDRGPLSGPSDGVAASAKLERAAGYMAVRPQSVRARECQGNVDQRIVLAISCR